MNNVLFRNGRQMILLCLWCIAVAAFVAPHRSYAQVLYGSLVGNVRDPSDAPVPGAVVIITNTQTNQSRQTVTNEAGGYSFPTVASGQYNLKVTK